MHSSVQYPNPFDCSNEANLLAAAAQIIARRFNERQKPFIIGIFSSRYCRDFGKCKEVKRYCSNLTQKYNEFNLLDHYDQPATLLGTDSPYDILLHSSNPRRKDIYIVVTTKPNPFTLSKDAKDQVLELRLKDASDLPRLESCRIFKQGPKVRFHNFKGRPITPDMLYMELKQLGKPTPPCKVMGKDLPRKRYILYPDGHFDCFELTDYQTQHHNANSLMDITWYTNYFKGFDPARELARKDWRARFCDYCEHCITTLRDTTWCDIKLNGWTKHKTFDRTKGPSCPEFVWRVSTAAVDWTGEDIKPKEGIDYHIWKNPIFKK